MCGIVGFTGKKNPKNLSLMMDSIIHRGPDGEGKYESDNFSLGMRRLCIIDKDGGWQPIWNEDKSIGVIFNGEVYNYKELRTELEKAGHKFRSDHSDTETVVHGYEEWGTKVLDTMRGMYAFTIIDLKKNELLIARDRLGIKPLYFTIINNNLHFASEIKALLKVKTNPKVNPIALHDYLLYRTHDHLDETFYKDIFRLPAGHYMKINPQGEIIENVKYWNPEINLDFFGNKSDKDYADELHELFIDSVKSHLVSDFPVGVTLSGGLDSTGVVCVMAKLLREHNADLHTKNLMTFSAVYPNDPIDESHFIDLAAEFAGAKQYKITPNQDEFWNEINNWIYTQEEPTISSAPYAIYSVMREAAKYVRVMLSGQGGDELFAGYIPYFASYLSSAKTDHKYWQIIREGLMGFDLYYPYFKSRRAKSLSISGLLNPEIKSVSGTNYLPDTNLNRRLYLDLTKYSIPNVLRYEDKNAMAFSIETRVPFLDYKFVEYVLKLPIDQKIKYGWNRYIYRNAVKGLIPEEIRLRRKKIGFTTPEVRWMRDKADIILPIFCSKEFAGRGIFDAKAVTQTYQKWVNKEINADAMMFWRILNTELWMRRFNLSL